MKIQKNGIPRIETLELPELEAAPRLEDVAERAHSPPSKLATGIDAGAASLRLSQAVKGAHEIALTADVERTFAGLVRSAALASDEEFDGALNAFTSPRKADLHALLELRAAAISPELDDPSRFLMRVAKIRARLIA